MLAYLARRLAFALFLVFAVSSASLVLARLAPGDYVTAVARHSAPAGRRSSRRGRASAWIESFAAQYRRLAAGAVRLDFGRSLLTTGRSRDLIPERAANTALLALTRAGRSRRSSACRSASSPAAAAAASLTGVDPRRVAGAAVDAAAPDLAVPGLRRGAHRLVADRRHAIARRAGGGDARSAASPGRAGAALGAAARRDVRAAAGAGDDRSRSAQPFVLATLARGVPRSRVDLARRAEGGAAADRVGLRPGRRHAAQRIVRRRSHHAPGRASAR